MRVYKEQRVPCKILQSVTCNLCGKEDRNDLMLPSTEEFEVTWGYGSRLDNNTYKFDICDECFLALINMFKIQPEILERT